MSVTSPTIQTALSHRSIRKFTDQMIDEATVQTLFECARAASSSNHLQCVSIIRVRDQKLREQLKHCASNQQYVLDAPEFWVFVSISTAIIKFCHKRKPITPKC